MKKIILPALASVAVIGLSACSEPAPTDATEETVTEDVVADPVVTEEPMAEDGSSMTIDESGMDATMDMGDTTATVDADGDPSMTVETN